MSSSSAAIAIGNAIPHVVRDLLQAEVASGSSLNPVSKVLKILESTAARCGGRPPPRLVAVTKKQGVEKVKWGYQHGLRHFGENYVKELQGKTSVLQSCGEDYSDIKWHYLGRLQRKSIKHLINCPGLWMVETLSKMSQAGVLSRCWGLREVQSHAPLKVMVQVNTSGEETKLGCSPAEVVDVVDYILRECPHLDFQGLMTIGRIGHEPKKGKNPDFAALVACQEHVMGSLHISRALELSMGMSADYEHAVEMGSTNVRVGSALFGSREK